MHVELQLQVRPPTREGQATQEDAGGLDCIALVPVACRRAPPLAQLRNLRNVDAAEAEVSHALFVAVAVDVEVRHHDMRDPPLSVGEIGPGLIDALQCPCLHDAGKKTNGNGENLFVAGKHLSHIPGGKFVNAHL